MRIQKKSPGLFFAAALFSFLAEASAAGRGISDYGTPGSPRWDNSGNSPAAYDTLKPADSLASANDLGHGDAPRGEASLLALRREAKNEKAARTLLGASLVVAGPILITGGFLSMVAEDIFGDDGSAPELMFGLGFVSLGTGIYALASPWSAERRWKRESERVLFGVRPDGKGARLVVRF